MKTAFTLAETLITLVIVGVVAALTVPNLIYNYQTRVTVTRLKQTYSMLSQAYISAIAKNGNIENWGFTNTNNATIIITDKINENLKHTKICSTNGDCLPSRTYYKNGTSINYNTYNSILKPVILSNGAVFYVIAYSADCTQNRGSGSLKNICAEITVDLNGKSGKNTWGKDHFLFWVTKSGIIPSGTPEETGSYNFDNNCQKKSHNGFGCTAWVISNENLDYNKCENLSWLSQKKCN